MTIVWTLVEQPLVHWYPAERLVEDRAEQFGYAGRCGGSHFLDQLVGVGVQEVVDGFACIQIQLKTMFIYV